MKQSDCDSNNCLGSAHAQTFKALLAQEKQCCIWASCPLEAERGKGVLKACRKRSWTGGLPQFCLGGEFQEPTAFQTLSSTQIQQTILTS